MTFNEGGRSSSSIVVQPWHELEPEKGYLEESAWRQILRQKPCLDRVKECAAHLQQISHVLVPAQGKSIITW